MDVARTSLAGFYEAEAEAVEASSQAPGRWDWEEGEPRRRGGAVRRRGWEGCSRVGLAARRR